MANIVLFIVGASIGSQFGTLGGVIGALIGLAIPSMASDSQPSAGFYTGASPDFSVMSDSDSTPPTTDDPAPFSVGSEPEGLEFRATEDPFPSSEPIWINPATGLPMMGDGIGGVDVGGNPFGTSFDDTIGSPSDDGL